MPILWVSAAGDGSTARRASAQAWRSARAWGSNFNPSVDRSVPARDRTNNRAPVACSSACTRADTVDCVICSRSAVR